MAPEVDETLQHFLDSISAQSSADCEAPLHEDASLRVWGWQGAETHRPRARVIRRLREEWAMWPDPSVKILSVLSEGDRLAAEIRIQATENGRYVEHNRSLFATVVEGGLHTLDLYCAEPIPSARRAAWIAPATLPDEEVASLLETAFSAFDLRDYVSPNSSRCISLRRSRGGSGDPHPGSNFVGGVRWPAEEADAHIAEIIAYHRERNIGFQWWVGPFDTPPDLPQRLEAQGAVPAGAIVRMARVGLGDLSDIPENAHVTVEELDGSSDAAIDDALRIMALSFHLTPAQAEHNRSVWYERIRNPEARTHELAYLARLEGQPAAWGMLSLRAGRAYLGGAATLPEYRRRGIYSTLLKRRLESARARGYHIAAIDAEPMSRRIVEQRGFKPYGTYQVYGWMPVIDRQVIRSLVVDE